MEYRTSEDLAAFDRVNTIAKLSKVFTLAKMAAEHELEEGDNADGGSCNLDTAAFRVTNIDRKAIEAAANLAGVSVMEFEWIGGKKWYWLNVKTAGQGDRRSRIAAAAQRVLDDAQKQRVVPGLVACMYQQMD